MKRINGLLLLTLFLFCIAALAESDRVINLEKTDLNIMSAPRPEGIGTVAAAPNEQQQTHLEPGLQAIEDNYRARLKDLKKQIAATQIPEEIEALQSQAVVLKEEWTLALANRQLELARERNDVKAIADISRAIENIKLHRTGGVK
jgi:hypothetical protein